MTRNFSPAIEFRHVWLAFGDKLVLRDVSFALEPGQMIIVTGASNSGKSVLLHLAIGLLRPNTGQVLIEGCDIASLAESELLGLRSSAMGIAFQEDTLFTALSTFDNAAYRLVEHNWTPEQVEPAVLEILRFVGLEGATEKLPEELSIGMRRRLEIARALIGWPRMMLFDEPASGLDPISARLVLDLVVRARDLHNISVLYCTKAMNEIRYLAHHYATVNETFERATATDAAAQPAETTVIVLDNGAIAFQGSFSEFEASALPSIACLTHLEPAQAKPGPLPADPWRRSRQA